MAGIEGLGKYVRALSGPITESIGSLIDQEVMQDIFFDVDEKATSIARSFGQGREHILAIKQSMTDAYQDVAKMGGSFDDINTIQTEIAGKLNRNVILSSESYKEFHAMVKVTNESIGTIIENFKNAGYSIYQASEQMQKVVDTARGLGLNVESVTENVINNMDALNKYTFQGGVEGLAKMAAQASSLRINMKETLQFADKVFNPEGAIETAAALQRLGVTQSQLLDPLRLMNLSRNDPAELQNQIVQMTKSFVTMGKEGNFEIMPGAKGRLMEISKAMGMSYNELTKMALGSAELDEKMKKIKLPDVDYMASKETRQLIANLAEKGKDGEYKIKVTDEKGVTKEKLVSELSPDDIEKLKLPPKKMEELAVDQLSVLGSIDASLKAMKGATGYAFAGTKSGEDIMQAEVQMYKSISDTFVNTFNTKEVRESMDNGIQGMFDSIIKGNTLEGFKKAGDDMYNFFSKISTKFTNEAAANWDQFITSENKMIKVFSSLGEQVKKLTEDTIEPLIKNIKTILGGGTIEEKEKAPSGGASSTSGGASSSSGGASSSSTGTKPTQDLISFPGTDGRVLTGDFGAFSFPPKDAIIAGDPNKLLGGDTKNNQDYEKQFGLFQNIIRTSESMQRNMLNQQQPNLFTSIFDKLNNRREVETKSEPINSNITLNLNVNVSGNGVSKNQVEEALRDVGIINTIRTEIQKLGAPNGSMSPTDIRNKNNKEKFV
jgi:hypothetical protein